MTWTSMQPESDARPDDDGAQPQEHVDHALPIDPGHVRTLKHYNAMLQKQQPAQ